MDYLETLPYNSLQRWAKKFKIRANQKAVKLRTCLLEHVEEIKLESSGEYAQLLTSSTPTKAPPRQGRSDDLRPNDNSCPSAEMQSAKISFRRNSFDDVCVAGETEFMKSFEAKAPVVLESIGKSDNLVTNERAARRIEKTKDASPCSQAASEKNLNATYDLCPCDDSMKENVEPPYYLPSPPRRAVGNGSVIVIEEDSAFFVYENSDLADLGQSVTALTPDKERKKIPTPKREVIAEKPPALSAASVKFCEAPDPQAGSGSSKPSKAPKSAGKAPNFQLIHQRQFARMESIGDFQKRRHLSAANKSKIPSLKSQTPFKASTVAPVKAVHPVRVNKTAVASTCRPTGVLTANSANVKQAAGPKGSAPVTKRAPLPCVKEKRKPEAFAGCLGVPSKKLRLDPPNSRPLWK